MAIYIYANWKMNFTQDEAYRFGSTLTEAMENLSKQIENDEKKIIKREKKALRQTADIKASSENITNESTSFRKLVEKIIKKNSFRSYRNINDIPN